MISRIEVERVKYEIPVCCCIGAFGISSFLCPLMMPITLGGTKPGSSRPSPTLTPFWWSTTGLPLEPENEKPVTNAASPVFTDGFEKGNCGSEAMLQSLAIGRLNFVSHHGFCESPGNPMNDAKSITCTFSARNVWSAMSVWSILNRILNSPSLEPKSGLYNRQQSAFCESRRDDFRF